MSRLGLLEGSYLSHPLPSIELMRLSNVMHRTREYIAKSTKYEDVVFFDLTGNIVGVIDCNAKPDA